MSRRLMVLWYLLGIFFAIDGIWIILLAAASGTVSQWVGGCSQLVGGVVLLTGAVIGHRRTRSR
jgi:uncharacterized membrane protein HdeD (DUF308 family)